MDQAHPGFPVLATYGGDSYYGFANYWGINFQGLDIPDGTPVAALTVSRPAAGQHDHLCAEQGRRQADRNGRRFRRLSALWMAFRSPTDGDLTGLTSGNAIGYRSEQLGDAVELERRQLHGRWNPDL